MEAVRRAFDDTGIRAGFREDGSTIRVGIALFNNAGEIDELPAVLDRLA